MLRTALTQEAWTGLPTVQPMSYGSHSLSNTSSHTAEPGALHLSLGGWGPHAKTRCGSLGRTCPWALMLRDEGTRQEETPHVKTSIKTEPILPSEKSDLRSQVQGQSDISGKTWRNSLSHENTSKASLLKDRIGRNK